MFYYIFTEQYCPLMSVSNAIVNTSACLADGVCQSGTVLEYSCTGDYTITTPVTVCLANTSWSHRPTCLKHDGGRLKLCKDAYFIHYDLRSSYRSYMYAHQCEMEKN